MTYLSVLYLVYMVIALYRKHAPVMILINGMARIVKYPFVMHHATTETVVHLTLVHVSIILNGMEPTVIYLSVTSHV